ncbi:MAG: hypothetical protein SCJ97_04440 [Bacillota bacterium]|nr:hypothetical protein [Bacillota bacterium]
MCTMVHPSRYGPKMLIGIGLAGNLPEDEVESFKKLVAHNAHNLQSSHLALVTEPDLSAAGIKEWFHNNLQRGGRNE